MRLNKINLAVIPLLLMTLVGCSKESEVSNISVKTSEIRASFKKRIGYLWINPNIAPAIVREIGSSSHDVYYKNLTHVIISFINPLSSTGTTLGVSDDGVKASITDAQMAAIVKALRKKNSALRIGIALGGGGSDIEVIKRNFVNRYISILDNSKSQSNFINTIVSYSKNLGFDFIDIDLEYEMLDIKGYNSFIQKLYKSAKAKGLNQTLTLEYKYGDLGIVTKVKNVTNATYASCDLLNIMSYDYNDTYSTSSKRIYDKNHSPVAIAKRDIDYFLTKVPADKIVLGIPFYGKSAYAGKELAEYIDIDINKLDQKTGYILGAKGSYYFNTKDMIKQKLDYVSQKNLCGVMFWSIRSDRMGDYNNSVLRYVVDNQK
jgi:GH18 family chitinase